MAQDTNRLKADQLGMPYGTASNKLRKSIMFNLLQKLGENVCCRCDEIINSADDMSIDHVQPWFRVSNELFWDLENIAFAHPVCNNRAGRRIKATICSVCGINPPGRRNKNGVSRECQDCNTKQKREWRAKTGKS